MSVAAFAKPCDQFSKSAAVYDLLHSRRDRDAEVARISRLIGPPPQASASSSHSLPNRLIDWGAGTGEHVRRFAALGWNAVGFDASIPMVSEAQAKNIDVRPGDICDMTIERSLYPAAVQTCLFAAFSYATAESASLPAALGTVRNWGAKGSLFVFDVVNYACCAAHLTPLARRDFEGGVAQISKKFDVRTGLLECGIKYRTEGPAGGDEDGEDGPDEFRERHLMRAFTPRELESALHRHGFDVLKIFDPESVERGGEIRADSYYFMVAARIR